MLSYRIFFDLLKNQKNGLFIKGGRIICVIMKVAIKHRKQI